MRHHPRRGDSLGIFAYSTFPPGRATARRTSEEDLAVRLLAQPIVPHAIECSLEVVEDDRVAEAFEDKRQLAGEGGSLAIAAWRDALPCAAGKKKRFIPSRTARCQLVVSRGRRRGRCRGRRP